MARDLVGVVDAMLAVVPTEEHELRARLLAMQQRTMYTAPEIMANRWHEVHAVLLDELHGLGPDCAWASQVASIFRGDGVPMVALSDRDTEKMKVDGSD